MFWHLNVLFNISLGLFAVSMAAETDAPVVEGNPIGSQYVARINERGIVADIVAETPTNGRGVSFSININSDRTENASYTYHIHQFPVPADGNCTAVGAHLDPYNRGQQPPCDRSNPGSCEVGDLSGKHGEISRLTGFAITYDDSYISLVPASAAFLGDKSLVIHSANQNRVACANFVPARSRTRQARERRQTVPAPNVACRAVCEAQYATCRAYDAHSQDVCTASNDTVVS